MARLDTTKHMSIVQRWRLLFHLGCWSHSTLQVTLLALLLRAVQWAITCDDPVFGGQGNPDTGDDFE